MSLTLTPLTRSLSELEPHAPSSVPVIVSALPPPPAPPPPPPSFVSPPSPFSPPRKPNSSPPSSHSSTSSPVLAAALGSVAVLLAVISLSWFLYARRKRKRSSYGREGHEKHGDNFSETPTQSGQKKQNPLSSETYPSPLVAAPPISNSMGIHSTHQQSSSTKECADLLSNSSEMENPFSSSMQGFVLGSGTTSFTYDELVIATNGFSSANLLGQGGFGYVHKGMLPNGKIVAVKSLKADSGQGEREFQAEVETISRVHHRHLVTLVGYCIAGSHTLIVYEYVQNKTMEFHLHGKGQPVMDWQTRLKIAVGAAKGLAYLHEDCHPKIIHRDIKAANILLEDTFEAQVADFGLAKFSSEANTHISTRIMGTIGYLAPEYASSGKLTDKSDVFSFGILLLEFITGRRPVDHASPDQMEDSLVDWARPLLSKALQDGNFNVVVDPRLQNNYNSAEMGAMITCAASCVHHSAKRRPRMSQVAWALQGNLSLSVLNDGVSPVFSLICSSSEISNTPNKEYMSRLGKSVYGSEDNRADLYPCPAPSTLLLEEKEIYYPSTA